MFSKMPTSPSLPTNVAKLIPTSTGHVVTTLRLLNDEFALFALSVIQVALAMYNPLGITISLVNRQQALGAVLAFTEVAGHCLLSCFVKQSLAVFFRTHFYAWFSHSSIELTYFFVRLLDV
jgi:hypothetical protein